MTYALTWLPSVLKDAGLKVNEIGGWQSRGHGNVGVTKGIICHHTAGPKSGNAPSLTIVTQGRSDLSGPLAQLVLGRDGTFFIIAAGLAYHAGAGNWQGVKSGNSNFIGIEAENTGLAGDPWPTMQMDAYARGCAAILKYIKAPAIMCCGHKEYALPKGRKPDPSFDMNAFRKRIETVMEGVPHEPSTQVLKPGDAKSGVVNTDNLNLREAPDGNASIGTKLPKGQKVAIVDEEMNDDTEWFRVWLRDTSGNERRGWVAARFIDVNQA